MASMTRWQKVGSLEDFAEEVVVYELGVAPEDALGGAGVLFARHKCAGVQPVNVAAQSLGCGLMEYYALSTSLRVVEQRFERM
jgi:hypothetical protein